MNRPIVRLSAAIALVGTALVASGCALYATPHGRVRVGVHIPLPVPVIRVPVYTGGHHAPHHSPAPAPAPYPSSSYPSTPHPSPAYPSSGHAHGYPSAGHGTYALGGVIRSVESLGPRGYDAGVRVSVLMDDQSMRSFNVPLADWRVGDRVRVEGARLVRG